MNYELAKKLKDAGFQSKRIDQIEYYPEGEGEVIFVPTLEELIEACAGYFHFRLQNIEPFLWQADDCGDFNEFNENNTVGLGKTPSEAVANLWLALQSKQKSVC